MLILHAVGIRFGVMQSKRMPPESLLGVIGKTLSTGSVELCKVLLRMHPVSKSDSSNVRIEPCSESGLCGDYFLWYGPCSTSLIAGNRALPNN